MEVGVMPREQITHNPIIESHTGPTIDGIPSATVNLEQPRRNVHVSWNRGPAGWVQVAVEVTVEELRSMLESAEAEAESARRANADFGEYAVDAHQFKVFSDVLDRHEVNSTIFALRKARDAAYGKDA
jgi:hypothetical protein